MTETIEQISKNIDRLDKRLDDINRKFDGLGVIFKDVLALALEPIKLDYSGQIKQVVLERKQDFLIERQARESEDMRLEAKINVNAKELERVGEMMITSEDINSFLKRMFWKFVVPVAIALTLVYIFKVKT